jgi:hypothetical protein
MTTPPWTKPSRQAGHAVTLAYWITLHITRQGVSMPVIGQGTQNQRR